jgi:glycosyltransferase involved in cell wall biosynthesis
MSAEISLCRPAVLMAHPTGNQNVRNALRSLVENEMLAEFWTTAAWNLKQPWSRLLPSGIRAQLSRRTFSEAPGDQIKTCPWREVIRLGMRATPIAGILCSGQRPFSIIGIYRHFDRKVANRVAELLPNMVYAYEGGALQSFRAAKKQGITTVYEQPSGYWHWEGKFFAEEAERNPEFASLLPALKEPSGHLEWKEEELRLTDYVFVPSDHVRQTLREVVSEEKIRVICYGAPPVREVKTVSLNANRPLRVIFAGSLIQRKGISYLLDAVRMLGSQVDLTLVGRRFAPHPRVDEACNRYRWIETLSHSKMLEMMQESDVLVLPSLTDAFGLVVTEALACGLPVIVTPNTGASEIINNGREGFVVPICRADAIAESLETLHRDRELLAEMSRQAQATAAKNSWGNYRANWARTVRSLAWH